MRQCGNAGAMLEQHGVAVLEQGVGLLSGNPLKRRIDHFGRGCLKGGSADAIALRGRANTVEHTRVRRVARIGQHRDALDLRRRFTQKFHILADHVLGLIRNPSRVAPGARQARYQAAAEWVVGRHKYDQDGFGCLLSRAHRRDRDHYDQRGIALQRRIDHRGKPVVVTVGVLCIKREVLALDHAVVAQAVLERRDVERLPAGSLGPIHAMRGGACARSATGTVTSKAIKKATIVFIPLTPLPVSNSDGRITGGRCAALF